MGKKAKNIKSPSVENTAMDVVDEVNSVFKDLLFIYFFFHFLILVEFVMVRSLVVCFFFVVSFSFLYFSASAGNGSVN